MNEAEKKAYLESYKKDKEKGVPFFPNILFKDAVISLVVFLLLIGLAFFLGTPLEERADPADTNYTPRPEWYFLFLFQLLKYFPGELEFVGVVLIPTIAILALFALPLLDGNRYRFFLNRKIVVGVTAVGVVGIVLLSVLSVIEAPPPIEIAGGDVTADLYVTNCAGCHGPTINVPAGTNLHAIIAQGNHEGMPAWSADFTNDEIDALAGFIVSPGGSTLFTENCSACHEAAELISANPLELRNVLDQGVDHPVHMDVNIPHWSDFFNTADRTALLNFLGAPDGQRLFDVNCSVCHGRAVSTALSDTELVSTISEGGLHLEMPGWRGRLNDEQLDVLARYVLDPDDPSEGSTLYAENCTSCHGDRIPAAEDYDTALEVIATGGSHETMPIWGDVLTAEQIDALAAYALDSSRGTTLEQGQQLYADNCVSCHGDFGEGGQNPARADDIIAPISTAEYLETRDDLTLASIITQGQPNFGMSPFGTSSGGPLDEEEVDAIVAYLRSWEANPPVELPPEITVNPLALDSSQIFVEICAQCHGANAQGGIGPNLRDPDYQANTTTVELFDAINLGHEATSMIAWGEVLSSDQITGLVEFLESLPPLESDESVDEVSFAITIVPIFEEYCTVCHGTEGGWSAESYDAVMTSGDNAPAVLPGDVENSLLAQKILGTQEQGDIMPTLRVMPEDNIQEILDWIAEGAQDN